MLPAAAVLVSDGKGSSFQHYEQQVRLWGQVVISEPSGWAALILQMGSAAERWSRPDSERLARVLRAGRV